MTARAKATKKYLFKRAPTSFMLNSRRIFQSRAYIRSFDEVGQ
jgi:hypothetical protein